MPEYLTIEAVSSTLHITPRSLRAALKRGTYSLDQVRVGNRVLIPRHSFEALLAASVR